MNDSLFMYRCLALAALGRGKVGNGAFVGSVLVRDGKVIAEAHHEEFGQPHAERALLETFTDEIKPTDTLYVNLEPCCHQGKTPPCTDILLERGIKRVVIGMKDPDPRAQGKGIQELRKNGVTVEDPIDLALCEGLNRGFITLRTKGRPWVTVKKALMPDGSSASKDQSRLIITNETQDAFAHEHIRALTDAILVGVETVIRDDPLLTIRHAKVSYQPYRIVLDPTFRIPIESKLLNDDHKNCTIIVIDKNTFVDQKKDQETGLNQKLDELNKRGVMVKIVSMTSKQFVWDDLFHTLTTPDGSFHGITSILVEGGARTWEMFEKARMIDEEIILTKGQ